MQQNKPSRKGKKKKWGRRTLASVIADGDLDPLVVTPWDTVQLGSKFHGV